MKHNSSKNYPKILILSSIFMLIFSYSMVFISFNEFQFGMTGLSISNHYIRGDPPVPIIEGIDSDIIEVFENQTLCLDASKSYDRDGRIVDFVWQVGDQLFHGEKLTYKINKKVKSIYAENMPVIFLSLGVTDDSGNTAIRSLLIKVLPGRLYLSKDKLSVEPSYNEKVTWRLRLSGKSTIKYLLPEAIKMPKCKIRLHLDVDRFLCFGIRKIRLSAISEDGKEIPIAEKSLRIFYLGDIDLYGETAKEINITGFKIDIEGFPLCALSLDCKNSYIEFSQSWKQYLS